MSMFQTPTRVWANAHPEYPGLFEIHSDSGERRYCVESGGDPTDS